MSLLLALCGCGPQLTGHPAQDVGGSADTGEPGSSSSTGALETSSSTGDAELTSGGDTSSSTTLDMASVGFIEPTDAPASNLECSIWDDDCPPGEKCMPWANDGGASWNATRCSPIADEPGAPGDPCEVEGNGVSGIDDCALHSMCWDVDPETNEGTCVSFCFGSESSPICSDPSARCQIFATDVLILCLPVCDPVLQDCSIDGEGCFPGPEGFYCGPDYQGPEVGDPCSIGCDVGLACIDAERVPGCSEETCCSEFCAHEEAELCSLRGQVCVPFFAPGQAPAGYAHVGVCALR